MDARPNDLAAFWMPFTANRQFKAAPRLLVAAEGMHYTSHDGRQVLDGTAGLWCVNAGHAHPSIVDAIQKQAKQLDFAPTFQMGHPLAFELAREPGLLQQYRDRIGANRETQPLFDMNRYAGNFADAVERIWMNHVGATPV